MTRPHKNYLLFAAFLVLAFATPCELWAASGQTSHFQFKGLTADAEFDTFDPSGCVETLVSLQAVNGRIKVIGGPQVSSSLFVFIFQADNCTGTELFFGDAFATLQQGVFQIDSSLKSATLNTTTDVFDFVSNTSLPVGISLTWTGSSQLAGFEDNSNFRDPTFNFKFNSRFSGTFRRGTASGSVTLSAANLAPGVTAANLGSVKEGELSVSH